MITLLEIETKILTLKDIRNIQLQNNYSIKILDTISNQVERIEFKRESQPYPITRPQPQPIYKTKSLFKPFEISDKDLKLINFSNKKSNSTLVTNSIYPKQN